MANTAHQIGWMFVQQYYSKLNSDPEHLYQFYNKESTLIHGYESEDGEVAQGQAQIKARVRAQNFNNCEVFVSSIDCLDSLNGGIVIQVLGEIRNDSRSNQFVQTFFLAQKPNGYVVLNDILRLIKNEDDVDEVEDDSPTAHAAPALAKEQEASRTSTQQNAPVPMPFGHTGQTLDVPAPTSTPLAGTQTAKVPEVHEAKVISPAPAASATAQSSESSAAVPGKASGTQKPEKSSNASGSTPAKATAKKVFHSAYLKNVVPETDSAALRSALESIGIITHLQIETDKERAFVDFIDKETLDRALELRTIKAGSVEVNIEPRKRRKAFK